MVEVRGPSRAGENQKSQFPPPPAAGFCGVLAPGAPCPPPPLNRKLEPEKQTGFFLKKRKFFRPGHRGLTSVPRPRNGKNRLPTPPAGLADPGQIGGKKEFLPWPRGVAEGPWPESFRRPLQNNTRNDEKFKLGPPRFKTRAYLAPAVNFLATPSKARTIAGGLQAGPAGGMAGSGPGRRRPAHGPPPQLGGLPNRLQWKPAPLFPPNHHQVGKAGLRAGAGLSGKSGEKKAHIAKKISSPRKKRGQINRLSAGSPPRNETIWAAATIPPGLDRNENGPPKIPPPDAPAGPRLNFWKPPKKPFFLFLAPRRCAPPGPAPMSGETASLESKIAKRKSPRKKAVRTKTP